MRNLKTIQKLIKSKLEQRLSEIFQDELEEYLEENCDLVSEDWGDVYSDDDVNKATRALKEEFIYIINHI